MNNILTVKDLSVTYSGKKVIGNINFTAEDGDFLVIFGENGSGKSSLVKALLGLKAPSDGKILFGDGVKHNEIGYLPQMTPEQKDFPASAMEVVLSGCLNSMGLKPFYGKKEKALARKNMELLSVYNLKNECFRTLSGGQKQRILLARALCAAKKLLILDEPVSGLDPVATKDFYEAITLINKTGVCIIMVSHDTASALSVAKHVLDIGNHTVRFFGTSEEYRQIGKEL